jgi:hypothetical protein
VGPILVRADAKSMPAPRGTPAAGAMPRDGAAEPAARAARPPGATGYFPSFTAMSKPLIRSSPRAFQVSRFVAP